MGVFPIMGVVELASFYITRKIQTCPLKLIIPENIT
jgi:hypothetical protein